MRAGIFEITAPSIYADIAADCLKAKRQAPGIRCLPTREGGKACMSARRFSQAKLLDEDRASSSIGMPSERVTKRRRVTGSSCSLKNRTLPSTMTQLQPPLCQLNGSSLAPQLF